MIDQTLPDSLFDYYGLAQQAGAGLTPSRLPTELSDRAAGKIYFSGGGTRDFPPPAAHLQKYKTSHFTYLFLFSTFASFAFNHFLVLICSVSLT